jgi:hypothetical protein
VVVPSPPSAARAVLESPDLGARGALVRCELPRDRALAALMVGELACRRQRARIVRSQFGPLGSRRALAGIEPGGAASRRAERIAASFGRRVRPAARPARARGEAGQALPLVLGLSLVLVLAASLLIALAGGVAGAERGQRGADLAAISAVRSMRDDLPRLAAPAALPSGAPNPYHLERAVYLDHAAVAAREAAAHNGLRDPGRLRVTFPDAASAVPLRARVQLTAAANVGRAVGARGSPAVHVVLHAEAQAAPPPGLTTPPGPSAGPATASGGGYSGPLAYRQGKPMACLFSAC